MSWSLTVEVPEGDAEEVSASLFEAGASGVEVRDSTTLPMPGQPAPAPGRALLVAWFADEPDANAARVAIGAGDVAEVVEQDWSETWKAGLRAFTVGDVFVRPSWIEGAAPPGAVEVVLDPGMAFGTGTHPTTSLCLAALGEVVRGRAGVRVLDVGTGSGLLAIAAARLGAARVVATDNDPVALDVAAENAARNRVALELSSEPPEVLRGEFDLVIANILANTLVELAPGIAARLAAGGTLLLSGILAGQEDEVRAAYLAEGLDRLEPDGDRSQGEWRLVALRRPA
ncbi:MAG TPA: 50S ribosomal protein L11 methyltransferase [Anaeromyxobacteraceae bacterium]|nr:50S ribosomal protein L11 methyltransferase [Anaeromyxobacteraceae bacterium]